MKHFLHDLSYHQARNEYISHGKEHLSKNDDEQTTLAKSVYQRMAMNRNLR
jgi:hypothetical protein